MELLNIQMQQWSSRLRDDLDTSPEESQRLASTVSREVANLPPSAKNEIKKSSPVQIETRIEELIAFQGWMGYVNALKSPSLFLVRAQVITQNYICFIYLKETRFEVLRKFLPENNATSKCCAFLLSDPIKYLRNAIAHGNWKYKDNFSGLEYWNRKNESSPYEHWEVDRQELSFWQALARCTTYASFLTLR